MRTVLSRGLAGLLREGLLNDLEEQASAVGECRGERAYVRCGVFGAIEQAMATAAVLDVVGWSVEDEDPGAVLDGGVHRDALLRGLRAAITAECYTQQNADTTTVQALAGNRAGRLLGLLKTVEGSGR